MKRPGNTVGIKKITDSNNGCTVARLSGDAAIHGDCRTALRRLLLDPVITDLDVSGGFWMIPRKRIANISPNFEANRF